MIAGPWLVVAVVVVATPLIVAAMQDVGRQNPGESVLRVLARRVMDLLLRMCAYGEEYRRGWDGE